MSTTRVRDLLRYVGVALLVMTAFLVFAFLSIAMRPLMIALAVVSAVCGVVLYRFSPRFREWYEVAGEDRITYNGLHLAKDVAIHPHHSWARFHREGTTVGADELVESTLGPVEAVDLPLVGSHVEQGSQLFRLWRADRYVQMPAPVSGTVVAVNEQLLDEPELVNRDPFGRGWTVRLQADRMEQDQRQLRAGKDARSWFRSEIDRLLSVLLSQDAVAPALPDGGHLVEHLYQEIDDQAWRQLTGSFFGMDE